MPYTYYMDINQNIVEYYDELYPVTDDQKKFYEQEMSAYEKPVKMLRIGCGTGYFEHILAKDGADITGLDTSREMLESANRKRRTQLMSIRFFQMSTLEMSRFLGKGFYNIISCLDNRIVYIHDQTLIKKFLFDCYTLMAPRGRLILELYNYDKYSSVPMVKLPTLESIRSKLYTQIWTKDDGSKYLQQDLETGNGKVLPVIEDAPVYALRKSEIELFAKQVGFSKCEFFGGFERSEYLLDSDAVVAVLQ
jgi:SAM-dependent methyltransferase